MCIPLPILSARLLVIIRGPRKLLKKLTKGGRALSVSRSLPVCLSSSLFVCRLCIFHSQSCLPIIIYLCPDVCLVIHLSVCYHCRFSVFRRLHVWVCLFISHCLSVRRSVRFPLSVCPPARLAFLSAFSTVCMTVIDLPSVGYCCPTVRGRFSTCLISLSICLSVFR